MPFTIKSSKDFYSYIYTLYFQFNGFGSNQLFCQLGGGAPLTTQKGCAGNDGSCVGLGLQPRGELHAMEWKSRLDLTPCHCQALASGENGTSNCERELYSTITRDRLITAK